MAEGEPRKDARFIGSLDFKGAQKAGRAASPRRFGQSSRGTATASQEGTLPIQAGGVSSIYFKGTFLPNRLSVLFLVYFQYGLPSGNPRHIFWAHNRKHCYGERGRHTGLRGLGPVGRLGSNPSSNNFLHILLAKPFATNWNQQIGPSASGTRRQKNRQRNIPCGVCDRLVLAAFGSSEVPNLARAEGHG